MSSPVAVRRTLRPAAATVARARLRVVPLRRSRAPRVPFVALVSLLLVGGVVGLLMFNTSMQQASFAATALQAEATALDNRQQTLEMELEQMRDPQRVAQAAQELGMVIPPDAGYVQPDGTVVGKPSAAPPAARLRLSARPPVKPAVLDPAPVVVEPERGERAERVRDRGAGEADATRPASQRRTAAASR